jgi:hypothetical protein
MGNKADKEQQRFEDDKLICEKLKAMLRYVQEQDLLITHLVRENMRLRWELIDLRDKQMNERSSR